MFSWNFTTTNITDPWELYSKNVTMDANNNVTFNVTAYPGLEVWVIIQGYGNIQLFEGPDGKYSNTIMGDTLDWDTTYSYFFTDSSSSGQRPGSMPGTFTTPEEPYIPPVWVITSADVTTKESGTWVVEVEGSQGIEIWIVIDGIGSFQLASNGPGEYKILIPYEEFENDKTYEYYFSDSEDGTDKAPTFSGSITTPKKDSREDSEDIEIGGGGFCCIAGILILIILIIIVVVVLIRKKDDSSAFEE
jgi:hypothetical protein